MIRGSSNICRAGGAGVESAYKAKRGRRALSTPHRPLDTGGEPDAQQDGRTAYCGGGVMSIYIECDSCAQDIDKTKDEFTSEELNRMGFEEGLADDGHVVIEARFSGRTASGHVKSRRAMAVALGREN
jgi:hypothetical protein